MPKDTNFLEKRAASGDFKKIYDKETVVTSIRNILHTPKNTRLFLPDYGVNLYSYIFEPLDDTTIITLRNEIYEAITKWEPRISLKNINIKQNLADNSLYIDIVFSYNETIYSMTEVISSDSYEEVSTEFTLPNLTELTNNLSTT